MDELQGLERLMTEFYHHTTSNERKRSIEEQLNRFAQQTGSWKQCMVFFTNTKNKYVMMYCLSVIENLANKMWMGVPSEDKSEMRNNLYQLLIIHHANVPSFIRNKLIKVMVDIGRQDWPMFFPDFFQRLLDLARGINDPSTKYLGLTALRMASEELAAPREELPNHRKEELKKLLLQQVPTILHIISDILEEQWKRNSINDFQNQINSSPLSMGTPPPSPETATIHSDLNNLFNPPNEASMRSQTPLPKLSNESEILSNLALECLCHLFSWIPLSNHINLRIINILFSYARYGLAELYKTNQSNSNSQSSSSIISGSQCMLGTLAMTSVNELMSKNCIPSDFEEYLIRVFQYSFHMLQQLTREANPQATLEKLDENYLEKLTEFLRLFVSIHFARIETNPSFPLLSFLTLLFQFTFHQPTFESYYSCLDIWEVFVDYLWRKVEGKGPEALSYVLSRYKSGLQSLMQSVTSQVQFRLRHQSLDNLDDECVDDNGRTEWEQFLIENLELIAKIAQLLPDDTMTTLYPLLEQTSLIYFEFEVYLAGTSSPKHDNHFTTQRQITIPNHEDFVRLHHAMKDLGTVLQAFGRLSDHFIGEYFAQRYEDGLSLVEKFINIALFGSRVKLYELKQELPSTLYNDVVDVHAQTIAVLQPFTHWLAQFYTESQQAGHSQAKLVELMDNVLTIVSPMINAEVPRKIVLSAAHTLLSSISTVRPAFLLQSRLIADLYTMVAAGSCFKLPNEIQLLVYRSLSNLLLLPWPNTPEVEQKWEERQANHSAYLRAIVHEFMLIDKHLHTMSTNHNMALHYKPIVVRSLLVLEDIVLSVCGEVSKSRQLCYTTVEPSIHICTKLLPIYISHPEVADTLMSYFLVLFRSLLLQMGSERSMHLIQMLMGLFTRNQLEQTITHENSAGVRVAEKFIKLLELVVEEASSVFKGFTSHVITLAVEQIYPIVAERQSPEVKEALFQLLTVVLSRKNRYFFPAPVLASYLTPDGAGVLNHKDQFLGIMQAFGQSFLQPEISLFRQNLKALEELNLKQKIYEKMYKLLKGECVLFQFINVLIQALIHKSHDLLQEEICMATWNMACVDFSAFHETFLLQLLHDCDGVTPDQKDTLFKNFSIEEDFPSYVKNLQRFVNDLRYFRVCNASLPEGTVRL